MKEKEVLLMRYAVLLVAVVLAFSMAVSGFAQQGYYENNRGKQPVGYYGSDFKGADDSFERGFRQEISDIKATGSASKGALIRRFAQNEKVGFDSMPPVSDFRSGSDRYQEQKSYGYSFAPEMMYGKLLGYVEGRMNGDVCASPESSVDDMMAVLRQKVGDFAKVCSQFGSNENCMERAKTECSRIGSYQGSEVGSGESGMREARAYACPPDESALAEACVARSLDYSRQRLEMVDELCAGRWDADRARIEEQCSRQSQSLKCDRDEYVRQCVGNSGSGDSGGVIVNPVKDSSGGGAGGERKEDASSGGSGSGGALIKPDDGGRDNDADNENKDGNNDGGGDKGEDSSGDSGSDREADGNDDKNSNDGRRGDSDGTEETGSKDGSGFEGGQSSTGTSEGYSGQDGSGGGRADYGGGGGSPGVITGNAMADVRGDAVGRCVHDFEKYVAPQCGSASSYCSRDGYIRQCVEGEKSNFGRSEVEMRINCKIEAKRQMRDSEMRCSRIEADRARCVEESSRYCEDAARMAGECAERFSEDKVRAFLLEHMRKKCSLAYVRSGAPEAGEGSYEATLAISRFATDAELKEISSVVEGAEKLLTLDDAFVIKGRVAADKAGLVKSLPGVVSSRIDSPLKGGAKASEAARLAASRLVSVSQSLPDDVSYVVEGEAADIAEASKVLEDVESSDSAKGVGYRMKLFLGLMKGAEDSEIAKLEGSNKELSASIESLKSAASRTDDPVAKAVLLEQVEKLSERQKELDSLISGKRKKANGFLSFFSRG